MVYGQGHIKVNLSWQFVGTFKNTKLILKKKHRKVRDNKYKLHNVGDNLDRVVRKLINANPGLTELITCFLWNALDALSFE